MKKEKSTLASKFKSLFSGNDDKKAPETAKKAKSKKKYTESCLKSIREYTVRYPGFDIVERPTPRIECEYQNRYFLRKDGYYQLNDQSNIGTADLMFTGDLMCRAGQQTTALEKHGEYRFDESYSYVKVIFHKQDLVMGNLETTLCARAPYMSEKKSADGRPNDNAPATYLAALRYAGFDALAMANNHNCDTGVYGILDTIDNVESYEFVHTGTFARKGEQRFVLVEVNGIKLAFISFATYYNAKDKNFTEEGQKVLLNKYSTFRVKRYVEQARKLGAEFVIAYIHWGKEFTHELTEMQEKRARYMAEQGVDYIIGSHPHALQRYDVIETEDGRRVPVYYSLGNFVSNMPKEITKDTAIVKVKLGRGEDGKVRIMDEAYIPCHIFRNYGEADHVTVPLVKQNMDSKNSEFFTEGVERIKEVMGDKVRLITDLENM